MSGGIRLSPRLEAVKSLVRKNGVIADIGCDHGHLICSLVESGAATRGFACDVNAKPLERAEQTILEHRLGDRISAVRTDGLAGLPYREIDVVIIAGMGGDLIAEILLAQPWTHDSRFQFLLQPMSKAENLRKSLFASGFNVYREVAVLSGNKVYTVLDVIYTGAIICTSMLDCYVGRLAENGDSASALYLRQVLRKAEKRAEGLAVSGDIESAKRFRELAEQIRKIV